MFIFYINIKRIYNCFGKNGEKPEIKRKAKDLENCILEENIIRFRKMYILVVNVLKTIRRLNMKITLYLVVITINVLKVNFLKKIRDYIVLIVKMFKTTDKKCKKYRINESIRYKCLLYSDDNNSTKNNNIICNKYLPDYFHKKNKECVFCRNEKYGDLNCEEYKKIMIKLLDIFLKR